MTDRRLDILVSGQQLRRSEIFIDYRFPPIAASSVGATSRCDRAEATKIIVLELDQD